MPHHKRLTVGQRHQQLTIVGLHVAHKVFQPLHQTGAIGFNGPLQCIGIGGQKVGRRQHINDLFGEISHTRLIKRIQRFHILHRHLHGLGVEQILLFQIIERGVAVPQRIGKAAVFGGIVDGRFEFALCQHLLRLDIMFQGFAPVTDLMFQHFGRILHHTRQIGSGGFHVNILPRPLHALICGLFGSHRGDQTGGQRLDLCQISVQTR